MKKCIECGLGVDAEPVQLAETKKETFNLRLNLRETLEASSLCCPLLGIGGNHRWPQLTSAGSQGWEHKALILAGSSSS